MQVNTNDSPRQPVWNRKAIIKIDEQVIAVTDGYVERDEDTRRCLCGARPADDGTLPCDH